MSWIMTWEKSNPTIIFDPSSSTYEINYENKKIKTIATKDPSTITQWVEAITSLSKGKPATVGFDINCQNPHKLNLSSKKKKPATLQLCIGGNCLIIQLCLLGAIPEALKRFLINPNFTFAAVRAGDKMAKLKKAYGLQCSRVTTIHLPKEPLPLVGFLRMFGGSNGTSLAKRIKKPKKVRRSRWEDKTLSEDQVMYASLDAYASLSNGAPFPSSFRK